MTYGQKNTFEMGSRRTKNLRNWPRAGMRAERRRTEQHQHNERHAEGVGTDYQIADHARDAIRWLTTVAEDEIQLAVHRGQLTLTGNVHSMTQKLLLEEIAWQQAGVKAVKNGLKILETATAIAIPTDITPVLHWQKDFFTELYDGPD